MNTVLFDLDGTLLPLDMHRFEEEYFTLLSKKFINYFPPERLIKYVWEATLDMIVNNGEQTNKEAFWRKFCKLTNMDYETCENAFSDFYNNEYKNISKICTPSKYIIEAINILKLKKYNLVVATNAIFPIEAIVQRIKWAGLDEEDFIFISSFEKMHYCKPNLNFYKEVLDNINKKPEECLMVGNDVEEDLVSSKLGIKTFLIKDNILNRKNLEYVCDFEGNYEDFYNFVIKLPQASVNLELGA
ncbi:Pyrophosphatase PpaX [Caloramator mitchellensis]|uniref:Pyrophosphatase PpaX n=1 Tax=Caloramator mitchellensis TaxID=908809 RepID=A0A0R3JWD4_CALMK|nr:HAD family hydrolase [Caloramator mitchellensis]KRQ86637.1 Pyrophosphatase PpaX [Caloramator mitchellensis]